MGPSSQVTSNHTDPEGSSQVNQNMAHFNMLQNQVMARRLEHMDFKLVDNPPPGGSEVDSEINDREVSPEVREQAEEMDFEGTFDQTTTDLFEGLAPAPHIQQEMARNMAKIQQQMEDRKAT